MVQGQVVGDGEGVDGFAELVVVGLVEARAIRSSMRSCT